MTFLKEPDFEQQGVLPILSISMTEDIRLLAFCIYAVALDIISTEAASEELGKTAREQKQRAVIVPLGRLGTVEDIAAVVRFFVNDEASYITRSKTTIGECIIRMFTKGLIRNFYELINTDTKT